jgi:hypothetical protein
MDVVGLDVGFKSLWGQFIRASSYGTFWYVQIHTIHLQNLSILSSWDCSERSLFEITTRSSTYAAKLIVVLEV